MKKANMNGVRPLIKNHPVMGRILTAGLLLVMPVAWVLYALKETWPDVRDEVMQMVGVIFLPWGDDS
jgi:hypothetical protein